MNHHVETGAGALGDLLAGLASELEVLGPEGAEERAALADLRSRLAEERFHLATLGQVKRGKSTLLNALLGEAVLPTAVVPLTAIPTFLLAGEERALRIDFGGGRPSASFGDLAEGELLPLLAQFVTEESNPENREGVARVEVYHPAPLLRHGVVLIDTPGTGSTLRHNTETTLGFLPRCDAALFLTSVDPPLTEAELAFLREARRRVSRLFFVLNKVDYLDAAEREQALVFFRSQLRERLGEREDVPIYSVSAKRGLEARRAGSEEAWRQSGMAEVEERLVTFLADEKRDALRAVVALRGRDIAADLLLRLRLQVRALELPLADVEARLAAFDERLTEARRDRLIARDLLAGDRRRLLSALDEDAAALRREARDHFTELVTAPLEREGWRPSAESEALLAVRDTLPDFFRLRLRDLAREYDRRAHETLGAHRHRAEEMAQAIRRAAADLFEIPYEPAELTLEIETAREPYWITQQWSSFLKPIPPAWIDRLVPAERRKRRVRTRLAEQLEALVARNGASLRWAVQERLDETFERFARALERQLDQAITTTRGALAATAERRRDRAGAVDRERRRLDPRIATLERLLHELESSRAG